MARDSITFLMSYAKAAAPSQERVFLTPHSEPFRAPLWLLLFNVSADTGKKDLTASSLLFHYLDSC